MSAKHTPEPWKCVAAEFGEDGTENEGLVAFWVRMPKPCISMAHADLIAAAPELLEALKHICNYIDKEGPAAKEWQAISEWCERGQSAIARAEGGQS